MRDCLIMGSGRSGSSMLGGILAAAGYFMGDDLYGPGIRSNPKGFFESPEINAINEEILAAFDGVPTAYLPRWRGRSQASRFNPGQGQRWLAALDESIELSPVSSELDGRIESLTRRTPFAFKDPRFSYTLPAWEPHLPAESVLICIFRSPQVTVQSILTECADPARDYLADLRMNRRIATAVWVAIHRSVLRHFATAPDRFVFVHYDQVFDGSALARLSVRLDAQLDAEFVDPTLKRTTGSGNVSPEVADLYRRLCDLAGMD